MGIGSRLSNKKAALLSLASCERTTKHEKKGGMGRIKNLTGWKKISNLLEIYGERVSEKFLTG